MPQSLTAARHLLRTKGHVNIADYLAARRKHLQHPQQQPQQAGRYAYLLMPNVSSLRLYTKKEKRYVDRELIKAEAMEPLMRHIYGKK
jgi:hypothetical protein